MKKKIEYENENGEEEKNEFGNEHFSAVICVGI